MAGFRFRVRDLMTREVQTLGHNDRLELADDLMKMERIRHLPVVDEDDGRLIGIVSQRDLFRGALVRALGFGEHGQKKILESLRVKEVMHTDVATVGPDAHVREAARLMLDRKIGCVVVMEGERLVGIVTESDFVALFVREDD